MPFALVLMHGQWYKYPKNLWTEKNFYGRMRPWKCPRITDLSRGMSSLQSGPPLSQLLN